MNESNFYKLTLFTFFIAFTIMGCKNKESDISVANLSLKKQNILFISIDDFRPKISSYGETKMITPNIDKLACIVLNLIRDTQQYYCLFHGLLAHLELCLDQ